VKPQLAETADGLAAQARVAELPAALTLIQRAQAAGDTVQVRLAAAAVELRRGASAAAAAQLRRAASLQPADPRPRRELQALYQKERDALPKELYGLLQRAHALCVQTPELTAWLAEVARLVEALDRPLLITVMGEFNAGKSTFVNALLGEEVAPMGITPTTATINLLKYGRELGGRVVYRDGQSRAVPWSKVPALLRGLDQAEAQRIKVVEVLYPLDVLQRVNVVDTPGLNSILVEHETTAREFIAQADAVIWLFTVDQAGKASEREALQQIRAAGKKILGVLNKIDRVAEMADWAAKLAPAPAEAPAEAPADAAPAANPAPADSAAAPLEAILAHLHHPDTGLGDLLEVIVPFSGREALLGRKSGDRERLHKANLPALEQALEERFFARAQAIKNASAQTRLAALLDKARAQVGELLREHQSDELDKALRLCQADALLFSRDFIPAERRRLIADADNAHKVAAREILDFVRPRRWPFGEHQAAPADRDFLLVLLDDKLAALVAASRARVIEALAMSMPTTPGEAAEADASGASTADLLRLLDEQAYGRYRAFSRGYLRGGKVDDFFVRVLPRLELTEAAIGRALERDGPTAVDILEAELLTPLRAFGEAHFKRRSDTLQHKLAQEELRRLDIDERVVFPIEALRAALASLPESA
jgi:small GTP-binding protein